MVEVWQLTIAGTAMASLAVWAIKTQAATLLTENDIDPNDTPSRYELDEVREMATQAKEEAERAQVAAQTAKTDIEKLSRLLVERTNDADEPLLVRIQSRLDSIESELQRQSRVETERAVNMERIATVLEQMEGIDPDDVDMDELEELLPDVKDDDPSSPYRRD